jgi:hypothetical protein
MIVVWILIVLFLILTVVVEAVSRPDKILWGILVACIGAMILFLLLSDARPAVAFRGIWLDLFRFFGQTGKAILAAIS